MTNETSKCECGGYGCSVRVAHGLTPFCKMDRTTKTETNPFVFGSYKAAAKFAAENGMTVASRGYSSLMTGSPRSFAVVAK